MLSCISFPFSGDFFLLPEYCLLTAEQEDEHTKTPKQTKPTPTDVQELLARLAEQQKLIDQQQAALDTKEKELSKVRTVIPADNCPGFSGYHNTIRVAGDSNSSPSNGVSTIDNSDTYGYRPVAQYQSVNELNRLQTELQVAQSNISALSQELVQTRITNHTFDQALSPSGDGKFPLGEEVSEHTLASLQTAFAQSTRPNTHRADIWTPSTYEEPAAEHNSDYHQSQSLSAGPYTRHPGIWGSSKPSITQNPALPLPSPAELQYSSSLRRVSPLEPSDAYGAGNRGWSGNRSFTTQAGPPVAGPPVGGFRRSSYNPQATPFVRSSFEHGTIGGEKIPSNSAYTPSPIGTPLSPSSNVDFTPGPNTSNTIWGPQAQVSPLSPFNFILTCLLMPYLDVTADPTAANVCLHHGASELQAIT